MVNSNDVVKWGYLLDPCFQFQNTAGKPLTEGYIEVYIAGTRDKYYCASDFDGTLHPFQIPLDSLGANIVLADPDQAYDVYVYNKFGSLQMSRYNVSPGNAGGAVASNINITSSDNTINVTHSGNNYDLSIQDTIDRIDNLENIVSGITGETDYVISTGYGDSGTFVLTDKEDKGIQYLQEMSGWRLKPGHIYQLNFNSKFTLDDNYNTLVEGKLYLDGDMSFSQDWSYSLDDSFDHIKHINGSTVIAVPNTLQYYDLKLKYTFNSVVNCQVDLENISLVDVTSIVLNNGGSGSDYHAGDGININSSNYISVDMDYINNQIDIDSKLSSAINIANSYTDNSIEEVVALVTGVTGELHQVNSDWEATSGVAEILHKPDLSVYATHQEVINSVSAATAVLEQEIQDIPEQVQSDWTQTNASAVDYIKNKPEEEAVEFTDLVAGNNITITASGSSTVISSNVDLTNYATHNEVYSATTSAVSSANSYTDTAISNIDLSDYSTHTEVYNATSSAVTAANSYTDTAVKLPIAWGGFDVQEGYRLLANITAPGAWNDRICTFNVFEKQAGQSDPVGQCGILTVQVRNSNNSFSYGVTYKKSANNRLDIVARSNTDKSVSLYVYSSGDIYGGLQLELVSSSGYTGNPTGREGITLYNNNSLQSTITGNAVTINHPTTYLENDSVTADKVKDNETLPVNITGYASHLRQARCRFSNQEKGYRLMAYLPPESGYSDTLYVFNIYEARDAAVLDSGVLKGTLSVSIRNNNGSYQYSSAYNGHVLSDISFELCVDASTNGVNLYASKSNSYYSTAIFELLNAYQQNGPEMNPTLYVDSTLLVSITGTRVNTVYTVLKKSNGIIPLAPVYGVGSYSNPIFINPTGEAMACDGVIAKNLSSSLSSYGTSGSKFRLVMKSAPLGDTVNVHFECKYSASNYSLFQSGTLQFDAVYSSSSNSITFSNASIINDYGSSNLWKFYLVPNVTEHKVEIYAESIGSNYNSLNLILLFAHGESINYVNGTTYLNTSVNSIPTPNIEVPVRKDVTTDTSVGSNTTPVYIDSNGVPQACDNRIHDLTLQIKYIKVGGGIVGRNILCDRQAMTGTAEQPNFTPISPVDLCTWLNRGDVVNIDFTTYDWWRDKYPGLIVEAQCDVPTGQIYGKCTNLLVLRKKIVNQQATVNFAWSNLITDEDTDIEYMEFQTI